MLDKSAEPKNQAPVSDEAALQSLQNEIRYHQRRDNGRSVLSRGFGAVWGWFQKDQSTVESMQALYQDAQKKFKSGDAQAIAETKKQIADAIAKDRNDLSSRDTVAHHASGFTKTAFLFVKGPIGTAGTIGVYGLDQWNPNSTWKEQIADTGLGMAKGGGMKWMFHALGNKPQFAMAKGVTLGIGNSILDVGLTRDTYKNGKDSYSLADGLGKTFYAAVDVKARAIDGAVFVASEGMFRGANQFTGGAVGRSPLLSTMFMGGAFGMSGGGVGEYMRQKNAGENFDLSKIVEHAAIQGLTDTAAASFGGMQALRAANRFNPHMREFVVSAGREKLTELRADDLQSRALLPVQERLGVRWNGQLRLGPVENLLLVHNNAEAKLSEGTVRGADRIACCHPELLGAGLKAKHLMPEATGELRMAVSADGKSITIFDAEAKTSRQTRESSVVLGKGGHFDGPAHTSGANIDKLLGGSGRGDSDPVNFGRAKPAEPAPAGDRVKVRINVPDHLVEPAQKMVELSRKLCQESASEADRQALIDHLRTYPQLKESAVGLADAFKNARLTEAVNVGAAREDGLVMRTYMVGMQAKTTLQIWEETKANYLPGLAIDKFAVQYQQAVRTLVGLYPEIRPAVDHFARTSENLKVVEGLDFVLGTKHADALRARLTPPSPAPEVVAGEPSISLAPDPLRAVAPEPIRAVAPETTGLAERSVAPEAAGERKASASAMPELVIAEKVKALSEGTSAERAKAATELVEQIDRLSYEQFGRWLQAVDSVEVLARGLDLKDSYKVSRTVSVLCDHLNQLSDLTFLKWKQAAEKSLLDGWRLSNPAIEYNLELSREFLSSIPSQEFRREQQWRLATGAGGRVPAEVIAPDWAKQHIADGEKIASEQRARSEERGRKYRQPWKPRFQDTLDNRLILLTNVVEAFDKAPASITPQAKEMLLRLGAENKKGLLGVLDAIGCRTVDRNSQYGPFTWVEGDPRVEANRRLMVELVPQAKTLEPLDYLFQFLRERNTPGAFAAAQEMEPQGGTRWRDARMLLSDLANGRIQSPRRDKEGKIIAEPKREAPQTQGPPPLDISDPNAGTPASKYAADADFQLTARRWRPFAEHWDSYRDVLSASHSRVEVSKDPTDGRHVLSFAGEADAHAYADYVSRYFQAVMPEQASIRRVDQSDSLGGGYVPRMRVSFIEAGQYTGISVEGAVLLNGKGQVTGLVATTEAGQTIYLPAESPVRASRRNNGSEIILEYQDGTTLTIPSNNTRQTLSLEKLEVLARPAAPVPPPAPPAPNFEAMDEPGRKQYLKERLREAIPKNAVSVENGPDGTLITVNGNAAADGAYRQLVEKPGEYRRYEFKNGDVITIFEGGRHEVRLAGGTGFELVWPAPPPKPVPAPLPPPAPEARTTGNGSTGDPAELARKALLDAVEPAKKLTSDNVSDLRDWLERQKAQLSEGKLRKKWKDNDVIKDLHGIKNVTFRQVCKLFNWVPEGVSN